MNKMNCRICCLGCVFLLMSLLTISNQAMASLTCSRLSPLQPEAVVTNSAVTLSFVCYTNPTDPTVLKLTFVYDTSQLSPSVKTVDLQSNCGTPLPPGAFCKIDATVIVTQNGIAIIPLLKDFDGVLYRDDNLIQRVNSQPT